MINEFVDHQIQKVAEHNARTKYHEEIYAKQYGTNNINKPEPVEIKIDFDPLIKEIKNIANEIFSRYVKNAAESKPDYDVVYGYVLKTVRETVAEYKQDIQNTIPAAQSEVTDITEQVKELLAFLREHKQNVGAEQAMKDFQLGLNLLYIDKNHIPEEIRTRLKEDGEFGEKTFAVAAELCKYYPARIIKKYIRRGAINNTVFDTKNDESIDTDEKVADVWDDLHIEERA